MMIHLDTVYQVLTFGNDIVYKTHLHPEKDEVFQMWNLQTGIKSYCV